MGSSSIGLPTPGVTVRVMPAALTPKVIVTLGQVPPSVAVRPMLPAGVRCRAASMLTPRDRSSTPPRGCPGLVASAMVVGPVPLAPSVRPAGSGPGRASSWLTFAGSRTVPSPSAVARISHWPGLRRNDPTPDTT